MKYISTYSRESASGVLVSQCDAVRPASWSGRKRGAQRLGGAHRGTGLSAGAPQSPVAILASGATPQGKNSTLLQAESRKDQRESTNMVSSQWAYFRTMRDF